MGWPVEEARLTDGSRAVVRPLAPGDQRLVRPIGCPAFPRRIRPTA